LSSNLPGHVQSLSKKSHVGSKFSFWVYLFYPSWYAWSCEDFVMLKRGRGYGWGSFLSCIISLCDLEPSYCKLLEKVKQPSHSEVNQDHVILSFSPALSSNSYPLIFLFESVAPKMSWRKDFSWLFKSKFLFEKFPSFCGLYPVLDLHSMVFKPLNLQVYPWKRFKLSMNDFGCLEKTGVSGFRNRTIRFSWV
jgi:hypothetical protein